ncbi:MAG: hypothetical protein RLZ37_864 [Actinomycetota bacterium]|jgi:hypothetical protein
MGESLSRELDSREDMSQEMPSQEASTRVGSHEGMERENLDWTSMPRLSTCVSGCSLEAEIVQA